MVLSKAAFRRFGRIQDLELDFADGDRPRLVTDLLAGCCDESNPDFWWRQTVAGRTAALLRLLAATEGPAAALPVALRCGQCGQPFEVALNHAELASAGAERDGERFITVPLPGERSVTIRPPTGDDLRTWRATAHRSRHDAVHAMLGMLLVDGGVEHGDETVIAEALAAHDPLVAFAVSCACPACDAEADWPIDLEGLLLRRLHARQHALLHEVHALASQYGWTESEILAVPAARRARYLSLIEGGP
jgi:hypothetical protein